MSNIQIQKLNNNEVKESNNEQLLFSYFFFSKLRKIKSNVWDNWIGMLEAAIVSCSSYRSNWLSRKRQPPNGNGHGCPNVMLQLILFDPCWKQQISHNIDTQECRKCCLVSFTARRAEIISPVLRKPNSDFEDLQELQNPVRSSSQQSPRLPISYCSFWGFTLSLSLSQIELQMCTLYFVDYCFARLIHMIISCFVLILEFFVAIVKIPFPPFSSMVDLSRASFDLEKCMFFLIFLAFK